MEKIFHRKWSNYGFKLPRFHTQKLKNPQTVPPPPPGHSIEKDMSLIYEFVSVRSLTKR